MSIREALKRHRLVPVAILDNAEQALRLAELLQECGLPLLEITLRTPGAEEALQAVAREYPDVLLGAGTVLSPDQLKRVRDYGASFAISPGVNSKVVETSFEIGIPMTPGVATPTDVELAVGLGCRDLKFFPAEAIGGIKLLKALIGPYGHWQLGFIPTGGITAMNALEYLALKEVLAVGGSWFVAVDKVRNGDWDGIRNDIQQAVRLVQ